MTDLDHAENDADQNFWYDPVANPVQPCSSDPPPTIVSADKKHWIEIALVDENGDPVPGQAYKICLPNGKVLTGTLDSRGLARVDGIDPGTCKVHFPDLERDTWDRLNGSQA
jgi:hypothetical protein